MGVLGAALPRGTATNEPTLKSDRGVYDAIFTGLSEPFEHLDGYNAQCKLCKGKKTGYNGEGVCSACHGTGILTEKRVKILYKFKNGVEEEEVVNFKLLPAGTNAAGQPLSPTTLFIRLRTFYGNRNATPEQLDEWYSSLTHPIAVPCTVIIGDNKTGTALKIVAVEPRQRGAVAPARVAALPPQHKVPQYDDGYADDEVPF